MQNLFNSNIKEIFTSIQGEGLYIGQKQIFVRFSRCNLSCAYCDTDFYSKNSYSPLFLYEELKKESPDDDSH